MAVGDNKIPSGVKSKSTTTPTTTPGVGGPPKPNYGSSGRPTPGNSAWATSDKTAAFLRQYKYKGKTLTERLFTFRSLVQQGGTPNLEQVLDYTVEHGASSPGYARRGIRDLRGG